MNKYKITEKIEKFAPLQTQEEWDCSGWLVNAENCNYINKIMLCLTVTKDVITQALYKNCDMIISHHPMFDMDFSYGFIDRDFFPKINIYCAHTNLDKASGGTTDTLIDRLGFSQYNINIDHDFLRIIEFPQNISVSDFSEKIKTISSHARLVNNDGLNKIKKVAFCAGSGSEFIRDAKIFGADCLVTGDMKFHTAIDSPILVYDIGHFESEILILPILEKIIGSDIDVIYALEKSPFSVV